MVNFRPGDTWDTKMPVWSNPIWSLIWSPIRSTVQSDPSNPIWVMLMASQLVCLQQQLVGGILFLFPSRQLCKQLGFLTAILYKVTLCFYCLILQYVWNNLSQQFWRNSCYIDYSVLIVYLHLFNCAAFANVFSSWNRYWDFKNMSCMLHIQSQVEL